MAGGDVVPPVDLTTAVIEAVNLILSAFGVSPLQILLSLFSGGRPKDQDTNNVIWAYHMSAYWPLQALGSDLAEMLKNGAPISDSRPQIQAQFGDLINGTVQSIQQLAGEQPGPNSPGYWVLFQLIHQSWKASGSGQQAVLQYTRAIDAVTQVLSRAQPQPPGAPPPSPPPGGVPGGPVPPPGGTPPGEGPCVNPDPDSDEILDNCAQQTALLTTIIGELQHLGAPSGTGNDPTCCLDITAAIKIVSQAIVALDLTVQGLGSGAGAPGVDLSGIQADLGKLAAALEAMATREVLDLSPLVDAVNNLANAIADPNNGIAAQVKRIADTFDEEKAKAAALLTKSQGLLQYYKSLGLVDGPVAQAFLP